jgi:hypothetical protein
MALPVMPRWVAPVLVVAFTLTTVWAAYNVANQAAAAQGGTNRGPPLAYVGSGTITSVASLAPNDLFNSTTVTGDNVTLFVSITHWINLTVLSSVAFSSPAPASLEDQFTVSLSTPEWSKTLEQPLQRNSSANTTGLAVVDRYDLNVSLLEQMERTIDAQLNYSSPSFTLGLTSAVTLTADWGGSEQPLVFSPRLNLTFQGGLIVPKAMPAAVQGTFTGSGGIPDPRGGNAMTAAYLELAASVGALAASVWVLWTGRGPSRAPPLPSLDRLIEPYEEVIARTVEAPDAAKFLPVERWEDLVKVADTLGRPILRPASSPSDSQGSAFYVFDGTVAYVYRYPAPSEATAARRQLSSGAGGRRGAPPPQGPPARAGTRPEIPPNGARPRPGSALGTPPKSLTDQLEAQLRRIRTAPLDPAQRWYAFSLCTQAVRTVSSADPQTAQRTVEGLKLSIDHMLDDARRPR